MKNIVFMTAIKMPNRLDRSDTYDLSIDSWSRWCRSHGHELFVLDQPLFQLDIMSPIFYRHYSFDLLDNMGIEFNQICTVDCDTIIHPDCPDFFQMTDGKYCGVHNDGDYDWIIRSIENYQFEFPEFFTKPFDIWKYMNSGFMITNRKFKFVHDWLVTFYWENADKVRSVQKKYGVGTDQPLINLITNELDVEVKILPYQFNMQDLPRKNALENFLFTKIPGIYHFNAIPGGPSIVNQWMKKTHDYFYA